MSFAITLDNATGVALDVLRSARQMIREKLTDVFADYLTTIPTRKRLTSIIYHIKDITTAQGFGIGSVGLWMDSMLLEGPTQTLENDIIL